VILSTAYILSFYQRAFLGPVANPELASTIDLRPRELLVAGVLGALVLAGGFFPHLVQNVTASAANAWVARLAVGQTNGGMEIGQNHLQNRPFPADSSYNVPIIPESRGFAP
jgi:NADH-quinone oxidoreductase subunit M